MAARPARRTLGGKDQSASGPRTGYKGRGAGFNPPNRFEAYHLAPLDGDDVEGEFGPDDERPTPTLFFKDTSRTILASNDSPDIPFTYSINPYRGCEHGCIYCYARPSHEYLGFSAGLDFETRILVKHDAPTLLERAFRRRTWTPQMVCLSGNTDPYQPVERKLRLTRRCLELFLKFRNPVGIITKNALVTRDIDILSRLAEKRLVSVTISLSSLDAELARKMEPRTSSPSKRLETVEILSRAGIPVTVLLAPTIPGLTDEEIPAVLGQVASRGARRAGYIMVRLPGAVAPLFTEWLKREFPGKAEKVLNRLKEVRAGKLSDTRWGRRMKGEGPVAGAINQLFRLNCERYGLNKEALVLETGLFRRPPEEGEQIGLFEASGSSLP